MSGETTLKSCQIKGVYLMLFAYAVSILNEVPTFMHVKFAHFTPSLQVLLVKQSRRSIPEQVEGKMWQTRTQ